LYAAHNMTNLSFCTTYRTLCQHSCFEFLQFPGSNIGPYTATVTFVAVLLSSSRHSVTSPHIRLYRVLSRASKFVIHQIR
jgi:hypothetical protein